jgi:GTPase KRas protein
MLRVKRGNPTIFILVGNQCDKTHERQVSKADGAALARQYGCDFMETSAKTTQNIERLFINIVRSLRQTRDAKSKQESCQSVKKERKSCDCVIV